MKTTDPKSVSINSGLGTQADQHLCCTTSSNALNTLMAAAFYIKVILLDCTLKMVEALTV